MRRTAIVVLAAYVAALCGCTRQQVSLWANADPIPKFEAEPVPDPGPDPETEVVEPTHLEQGDPAPGSGMLLSTSEALELSHYADVVVPQQRQAIVDREWGWQGCRTHSDTQYQLCVDSDTACRKRLATKDIETILGIVGGFVAGAAVTLGVVKIEEQLP